MQITCKAEVLGQSVTFTIDIAGEGEPDEGAVDRMYAIARRECQRFAEIAGVNVRDQKVYAEERERIRNAPKDRPAITLAAGTKDPKAVAVTKGTFEIGGKKVSAPAGR